MKTYNKNEPLIFIHVPKTAGTSTLQLFDLWYKDNLYRHYYNEYASKLPIKHDIKNLHTLENPLVVYGHFNSLRGFGIEDYYPDANQFVTILRDPLELMVSSYFYIRKNSKNWVDKSRIPQGSLEEYIKNERPNMLNHFPRHITFDNYKEIIEEYFIEIGIVEELDTSMREIATKLGLPYQSSMLGQLNKTKRDQVISDSIKEQFMQMYPLEYAVYNYAAKRYLK